MRPGQVGLRELQLLAIRGGPDGLSTRCPRIAGARFVSLESGGRLMLGQEKNLAELATFLADSGGHLTQRVAS